MNAKVTVFNVVCFICAGGVCRSQNVLLPTRSIDLRLQVSAAENRLHSFSLAGDTASTIVSAPGQGLAKLGGSKMVVTSIASGSSREIPVQNLMGQTIASAPDWMFSVESGNGAGSIGRLVNTRTGESNQFSIISGISSAVFDGAGTRLALLGFENTGSSVSSRIAVYDVKTRALLGSLQHPAFPAFAALSFTDKNTLILIETAMLRYTPIGIPNSGKLVPSDAIQLTGTEVDESVRRSKLGSLPANARPRLIIAHMPGDHGTNFFFLSPFRTGEGLRLAEFDSGGKQVGSFRVRAENESSSKAIAGSPLLLSAASNGFSLLGQDGVLRTYERAQ